MEQKRDFLDFLETILKHKKLLIYTFFTAAILSLIISLLLPLWYRSSAKVFFPEQDAAMGLDMSAVLGNVPIDLGTSGIVGNERLNSIFSSRVFLDDVIDKFHLQEVYDQEYRFKTREMLADNINTEVNYDDQSITVSFDYKEDPQKAYEICTYMLNKANELNMEIQSKEARNNRSFIGAAYSKAQNRIKILEDSLRQFQQKYNTYLLDEQITATIEAQAVQEAQLMETRIEYDYMSRVMDKNSPKLRDLKLQIEAAERELTKGQNSAPEYSVLLPLKKISQHAFTYYRLKREIEIGAKVLEFLTPQYEQTKIKENQSQPSFVIMDPPDIPEYKYKPKRAFVVIGATFFILLLVIIYILIIEAIQELKINNNKKYQKLKSVLSHVWIYLD